MVGFASASTVKLQCTIIEKNEFSSGAIEKNTDVIILDIDTFPTGTIITGSGDSQIAIASVKTGSSTDIVDASDSGKWDISANSIKFRRQLRIDRNTGALYYQSLPNNRVGVAQTVTGQCEKVDTTKRKF